MIESQRSGTAPPGSRLLKAAVDTLLEMSDEAAWILSDDLRLWDFNVAFIRYCEQFLGRKPEIGMDVATLLSRRPNLREFWMSLLARTAAGKTFMAEGAMVVGEVRRRYQISGRPIEDQGKVIGSAFVVKDLTDIRRRRSHEFFERALARIFARDETLESTLARVIEAFCESVGWEFGIGWIVDHESERLLPRAFWHSQEIDGEALEASMGAITFGRGHGVPGRVWEQGSAVWLPDLLEETNLTRADIVRQLGLRAAVAFPLRDEKRIIGVLEFFSFNQRPAEEELLLALDELGSMVGRFIARRLSDEERHTLQRTIERKGVEWSTTFDAIPTPILVMDLDGHVQRLNFAARDLTGASTYRELIGKRADELGTGDHWPIVQELVQSVKDARSSSSFQLEDPINNRHWEITATYCPDAGEGPRAIVILVDVTRLFALQESLRTGEQLWAMGELVAGVAHEVRNPLFGISATLDALEMTVSPVDETRELFVALRKWIERLNELMVQLLEYGKSWNLDLRAGSLQEVITQALEVCEPVAEKMAIRLQLKQPSEPLPVLMDASRLVRVFQNLITNAIQHSPHDGAVEIFVTHATREGQEFADCEICDRGPGFRPEDLHRVFQPFFTRRRGGTGLGLSIVQRIVDEHGGIVRAENRLNGGALVRLTLPLIIANSSSGTSTAK